MTLKNFKKPVIYLYLTLVVAMFNCSKPKPYYDLSLLLNKCDGYAVVVAAGKNDGYIKSLRYWMVIKDDGGKLYTYQGVNYNFIKGDTLMVK